MRELFLYPITGLYDECHHIDYASLTSDSKLVANGRHCLRPIGNVWWREALGRATLELIVARLQARYRYSSADTLHHRAVLADPEKFIEAVQEAPRLIANLGAGAQQTFRALEALQIFCNLYSETISAPFVLSLQEGLVVNELSSLALVSEALNPITNPYLEFIQRHYLPILREVEPQLVWIVGPIKMSTFAMAMLARDACPGCHISVVGHSTEYYSLNKITNHLRQNTVLFSVIDSIVLEDFENAVPKLIECLHTEQSFDSVPNLIYVDRRKKQLSQNGDEWDLINLPGPAAGVPGLESIKVTATLAGRRSSEYWTELHPVSLPQEERQPNHVDPSEVADVKLWPNAWCYWDQCTFCAINRKYQALCKSPFQDVEAVADYMVNLSNRKVEYLWSIDEAIPPESLEELAKALIARRANLVWGTRSRIDQAFSRETCNLLGQSGLREIRLGLESASPRVLSAMNKFPKGWSVDLVEQLVCFFDESGVSVHFPVIVGFPTESDSERAETFAFLQYITAKYPSVTFNVNILGLDIASELFRNYERFGITMIRWPTPAKYLLGNLLDWDCVDTPFEYERLDQERNLLMRELLYPWMPSTASIPPYIFYRLSETSRATLPWKSHRHDTQRWNDVVPALCEDEPLIVSPALVVSDPIDRGQHATSKRYTLYDWRTHHTMECDEQGIELIQEFRTPQILHEVVTSLHARHCENMSLRSISDFFTPQIRKLYMMGVLYHVTRQDG